MWSILSRSFIVKTSVSPSFWSAKDKTYSSSCQSLLPFFLDFSAYFFYD